MIAGILENIVYSMAGIQLLAFRDIINASSLENVVARTLEITASRFGEL